MKYTLHLASASNDHFSAYSFLLTNYEGAVDEDVFIAMGERKFDESYCGHIALQRALRRSAKAGGVVSLRIVLDESIIDPLGYEVLGVTPPLYPGLHRTTSRILRRFNETELASARKEDDASPEEVAVVDEAIEALERAMTPFGRLGLFRDRYLNPNKIIQ
ncbi:hypothetical protein [Brevibacillus borstelensis]|uniref:hypothetical protein n=1 Tax=Brevibacillus borstelensis TaxID=45462 RepID=UPI000468BC57|nr:hypothetical protein [Brevibacillus borstelensis]MCC0566552.1 hypothetical protein [Brevibacillus borstelensis]MCM3473052.1 hypothetical protein [Brevibacillus borstelensis]MCM3561678.1 hypothetical protein [Brevibacillus borstelensis]MED1852980.1 hypothetical protein [Brevibacillus borstelensis]